MERAITERAYAKVNLNLYITGTRDDGYHNLHSVMQSIDLYDEVTVTPKCDDEDITVTCNEKSVPKDSSNTCYRTCRLLKERYAIKNGYHIDIQKNIPVGAGLGGPSADAAAVIRAIDTLEGLELSSKQLIEVASKIGADVPFMLMGGTVLCNGIGDILTPIDAQIPGHILLAKPNVSVSTKWAYEEFDIINKCNKTPDRALERALEKGDYKGICKGLCNDLELPVLKAYPEIKDLKEVMLKKGADASMMSGSGSCVFGLFKDMDSVRACMDYIKLNYTGVITFPAKPRFIFA